MVLGVLQRKTANKFDGINPEAVREYNKYKFSKNMGIAVVGTSFENILDNGGRVIKLVFQRYQSYKFRQRKLVGNNAFVIKNKGDVHYVYFHVTGPNDGTSNDTKCLLQIIFEKFLFIVIEILVCGGGLLEWFDPVIQSDNSVPHQDAKLYKYVVNFCKAKKLALGTSSASDGTYE